MSDVYKKMVQEIMQNMADYFLVQAKLNNVCDTCNTIARDMREILFEVFKQNNVDIYQFTHEMFEGKVPKELTDKIKSLKEDKPVDMEKFMIQVLNSFK